ncbi:hypothetical protein ACQP25_45300 (plasmid) [Microtetraspora malaysiensis]|uniref:hypothetical protein n=1 Tax=Microtetraspora malaysiensis TaxID=161358 RepID=UPI003D90E981
MSSVRRSLSITAIGLFAVGALGVGVSTGTAHASVSECVGGANGFADIAYNKTGTVVSGKTVDLGGGRRAELHTGTVAGFKRGWAIIRGTTKKGDRVWMDWTKTATRGGWMQCGPFTVQSDGLTNTSAAQKTSDDADYWFRACGQIVGGATKCGAWW